MNKLKVAIVGCGRISVMYKTAFKTLSDEIEVVIAMDIIENKAKAFAEGIGCPYSTNFEDVLSSEAEIVHICTPHHIHKSQAIACMRAGKNVLTEKPMAISLEDADEMIAVSEQTGMLLGVIFQSRYIDGIQEMKRIITEGKLGKILGAWSTMNWSRPPAYYKSTWKGKWATEGGGVLIDQAIHTIDMVQWLVDSPVKSIKGHIDTRILKMIEVEDVADAVILFENDCIYSLFACNYYKYNSPIQFEICGENGRLQFLGNIAKIKLGDEAEYTLVPPQPADFKGEMYWGNFHIHQLKDFYNSVRTGSPLYIDGKAGRKALEIVLSIYRSSKENKEIDI